MQSNYTSSVVVNQYTGAKKRYVPQRIVYSELKKISIILHYSYDLLV